LRSKPPEIVESGVDASVTQSGKNGKGHGLFQLTDPARKASFKQFNGGKDLDDSNADQQIKYQLYELAHGEQRKFALAQRVGSDAASRSRPRWWCSFRSEPP
jgi:hypothetical protein